jgi:hypothetical protein
MFSFMASKTLDCEARTKSRRLNYFRLIIDQGILTPEIEAWRYEGQGTAENPYIVTWIDADPRDPRQWSWVYKWFVVIVMAFAALTVTFASSAFSGGNCSIIMPNVFVDSPYL